MYKNDKDIPLTDTTGKVKAEETMDYRTSFMEEFYIDFDEDIDAYRTYLKGQLSWYRKLNFKFNANFEPFPTEYVKKKIDLLDKYCTYLEDEKKLLKFPFKCTCCKIFDAVVADALESNYSIFDAQLTADEYVKNCNSTYCPYKNIDKETNSIPQVDASKEIKQIKVDLSKYRYFPKIIDNKIIVVTSKFHGKTVTAKAKCHPDDIFDFEEGYKIAVERLQYKLDEKRLKYAQGEYKKMLQTMKAHNEQFRKCQNFLFDCQIKFTQHKNK